MTAQKHKNQRNIALVFIAALFVFTFYSLPLYIADYFNAPVMVFARIKIFSDFLGYLILALFCFYSVYAKPFALPNQLHDRFLTQGGCFPALAFFIGLVLLCWNIPRIGLIFDDKAFVIVSGKVESIWPESTGYDYKGNRIKYLIRLVKNPETYRLPDNHLPKDNSCQEMIMETGTTDIIYLRTIACDSKIH